ncbi:MAG: hypothetical protein ACYDCO_16290 [Armatimonadota bacterium]
MRCQECLHEWTPPPTDKCPQCWAMAPSVLPRFDPRPRSGMAFMALTLVFATLIAIQFTLYATVLPIISIVLAVLGLVEIRQSKGRMTGTGLAVVALIVSAYFLFVGVLGLIHQFR